MISEYKKGKTPNPDVMCNRYVKFGTFLEFAKAHGAQKIATGHYAQIKQIGGQYELHRGADPDKDQSYFLWTLTQVQLQHIHFPIGDTRKKAVRKEAEEAEIPTFSKPDSQGICFLGPVDMPDFLSHYLHIANGSVLDAKGAVVGEHKGALLYTSGQRHGFLVHASGDRSAPLYVVGRDLEANTVTVSPEQPKSTRIPVSLSHLHFVNEPFSGECEAQFRYRQRPFKAVLEYVSEDHAHIEVLDSNVDAPSEGQSCVFYRGTRCLGGAIIDSQPERKNIDE
jgi:tRNA-specific 2-thiouridylase